MSRLAALCGLVLGLATPVIHHTPKPEPVAAVWTRLAACESGGNWRDTAGGYEGGVQFLNSTWLAHGGARYAEHAYDATEAQQIAVARLTLASGGVSQWPECGPRVGLTMADGAR